MDRPGASKAKKYYDKDNPDPRPRKTSYHLGEIGNEENPSLSDLGIKHLNITNSENRNLGGGWNTVGVEQRSNPDKPYSRIFGVKKKKKKNVISPQVERATSEQEEYNYKGNLSDKKYKSR